MIEPDLPAIVAGVDAERALRARALLDGGVDGLLAGLRPHFRWRPPILEIGASGPQAVCSGGNGLELIPAFFCRRPITIAASGGSPLTVVYPLQAGRTSVEAWEAAAADLDRPLAALLGPTRARVLGALEVATTTELAERCGIAAATASQHATILRTAGLVSTERRGGSVLHTLTRLGSGLLRGRVAGPRRRH